MKDRARAWAHGWNYPPAPSQSTGPISYVGSVFGGMLLLILTFIRVILSIVLLGIIFAVLTGSYTLPRGVELWQALLFVSLVFVVISIPLRALRWTAWGMMGRPYYDYRGAEGVVSLVAFVAIGWLIYQNIPEAHAWMDRASAIGGHMLQDLRHDLGN